MIVKIKNARKYTWYENKLDWEYEVEMSVESYLVKITEFHLWPLFIYLEDVEIIKEQPQNTLLEA